MADGKQASMHADVHVRRISAGNPNTPEQTLSRLSEDDAHRVRHRVAENPRTPSDVLTRLAGDQHIDVRLAVAENPTTPATILARLAKDLCADVRYGVAENPHMPEGILFDLTDDDNPYVRCRALRTLQVMTPEVQARFRLKSDLGEHRHVS